MPLSTNATIGFDGGNVSMERHSHITDDSRALRHRLGSLCLQYNALFADKDTIDFRLGSPEPYVETEHDTSAEAIYEAESHSLTADLRSLIVELMEVAQRIRGIEDF
jgi:hypothetical protein